MSRPTGDQDAHRDFLVVAAWALCFMCVELLLRVSAGSAADAAWALLGAPGQWAMGLLLGAALWSQRGRPARWLLWPALLALLALDLAVWHYEAVQGRFPDVELIYYLGDLAGARGSVEAEAPLALLALKLLAALGLLGVAFRAASRRGSRLPSRAFRPVAALSLACVLWTVGAHAAAGAIQGRAFWATRLPLLWMAQNAAAVAIAADPLVDVPGLQRQLGHARPFGGADPRYPLCGKRFEARAPATPASVIFLILESVGERELRGRVGAQPLMPQLARIARDQLHFERVYASGSKSHQALVSIFTGLPAQPERMLWRKPLNRLEGWPAALRRHGYHTAYLHGGDLSFEQQRSFLKMVGFQQIEELGVEPTAEVIGWGYSDEVMFARLREAIVAQRSARPDQPYLFTLFTLSTHHPYTLPQGQVRTFAGSGPDADYMETLRYTDRQLGVFYDWYLAEEAPRGTLLVITGDHVSHLANAAAERAGRPLRYDVPLVVAGLPRGASAGAITARLAGHQDIGPTLRDALGIERGRCEQGVSLLGPAGSWPSARMTAAVDGEDTAHVRIWQGQRSFRFDRRANALAEVQGERFVPTLAPEVDRFARALVDTGMALYREDRFAPSGEPEAARAPLPRAAEVRVVSHRGHSSGAEPVGRSNRLPAIERAIARGFRWIEVDVGLTKDHVPVVVHDQRLPDASGTEHWVHELTLAQLRALPDMANASTLEEVLVAVGERAGLAIELKPQMYWHHSIRLAREIARLLSLRMPPGGVIIDTFDFDLAAAARFYCSCDVGHDAPFAKPVDDALLQATAGAGLGWIYVEASVADAELVERAHRAGLKLMVYTVNEAAELERFAGNPPDGVITDRAELLHAAARLSSPRAP